MCNTTTNTEAQLIRSRLRAHLYCNGERITALTQPRVVDLMYRHLINVILVRWPDKDPKRLLENIREREYLCYTDELWDELAIGKAVDIDDFADGVIIQITNHLHNEEEESQ